jgi:two-component system response regulator RstA
MESQISREKNIWILAHRVTPDPSLLENLMVGGYRPEPVTIGHIATLHPPKGTDLALLDLAVSTPDATTAIIRLREHYKGPLAVLDAYPNERRHILALEIGADDYLQKPISVPMLTARIEALLRRYRPTDTQPPAVRNIGDIVIDATRREVTRRGQGVSLTTVEFKLLWYLASHAGTVVSRNDIHLDLYKREYNGLDRSVDMYISRLRKKLGDDPIYPRLLKTVRGEGYLFVSA